MMAERFDFNRYGERLSDAALKVPLNEMFLDSLGMPRWNTFTENADTSGFDINNVESNGDYIQKIVLPIGKRIIRFGLPNGAFTTDEGTDYSLLALPYTEKSMPYHEYIVEGKCEVECVVDKGRVAPGFGSRGGAIRYRHYHTMKESITLGILKEDMEWLRRIKEIVS
ncbi:MAG: TNT domain-containing protein [Lachnospiraceae bacterium]|nr:TNT domain-containing protein [Lachnospiraceae bacterium]